MEVGVTLTLQSGEMRSHHRETLKWGGQGDRKGTWKVAEAAGSHSARVKDKGSPTHPSVHARKVLMNGSGGRGSRVCGRPQEARERAGEMTDRSRELQLQDSGTSYVTSLQVKAWQRQGMRQSRLRGGLSYFFPASPRPLLSPQTSVSSHLVVMETGWNRTDGLY